LDKWGGWEWEGDENGKYVWNGWEILQREWTGSVVSIEAFPAKEDVSLPLLFERSREFARWQHIPPAKGDQGSRSRYIPLLSVTNYASAKWARKLPPEGSPPAPPAPGVAPFTRLTPEQLATLWALEDAVGIPRTPAPTPAPTPTPTPKKISSPPAPTDEPRAPEWWNMDPTPTEFYRVRFKE
jgi:hypothetical protein